MYVRRICGVDPTNCAEVAEFAGVPDVAVRTDRDVQRTGQVVERVELLDLRRICWVDLADLVPLKLGEPQIPVRAEDDVLRQGCCSRDVELRDRRRRGGGARHEQRDGDGEASGQLRLHASPTVRAGELRESRPD